MQKKIDEMAWAFYWSRQPKGTFLAENSRPDIVIGFAEGMRIVFERMDLTVADISETIKRIENSIDDSGSMEQKTKDNLAEISQKIESLKESILHIQK